MSAREVIIAAAANPKLEMDRLVAETRREIHEALPGATALAYTVLGLSLENGLSAQANVDVIEWLLDDPNRLSPAVLTRIQQFSEAIGSASLSERVQRAIDSLP